jgi:hypothetical protein
MPIKNWAFGLIYNCNDWSEKTLADEHYFSANLDMVAWKNFHQIDSATN